ncbi:hypothetical protein GOD61_08280 [Sinorhizobium medicae]|nr:hypothetical protein [Sinorhizobium medicae]
MQPNGGIQTQKIIAVMADTMISLGEGCTEREVMLTGKFTEDQVKLFGPRAAKLATAKAIAA